MIGVYLVDDLWTVKAPVPPRDEYQKPYDPIVKAVKGLVMWKTKLVMNIEGQEVVSNGNVLLKNDTDLGHDDQLRIYDSARGKNIDHPIIIILPAKGFFTAGIYVYL